MTRAVLIAALCAAAPAAAGVRSQWGARLVAEAGYDSNVLLTGAGGDEIGRLAPQLDLALRSERLRAGFDYGGDVMWFRDRAAGATSQQLALAGKWLQTRRLSVSWELRGRYANDPLALARFGLIRPQGEALLANGDFGLRYEIDARTELGGGYRQDRLYFGARDPASGAVHAPYAFFRRALDARTTLGVRGRAQLFAADRSADFLGTSSGAFLELSRRLTPHLDFTLSAGPMIYLDAHNAAVVPRAFATLEYGWRTGRGLHVAAGRDLVIGAGHAGALVGDLVELGGFVEPLTFLRLAARAGYYRNGAVPYGANGVGGYLAEGTADFAVGRGFFLGATATRLAGLDGLFLDRNVVTVHVGWQTGAHRAGE